MTARSTPRRWADVASKKLPSTLGVAALSLVTLAASITFCWDGEGGRKLGRDNLSRIVTSPAEPPTNRRQALQQIGGHGLNDIQLVLSLLDDDDERVARTAHHILNEWRKELAK